MTIRTLAAVAASLADAVNTLGREDIDFATEMRKQHRTLQQASFKVILTMIAQWSEEEYFDGRNEFTVKACREIVKTNPNLFHKDRDGKLRGYAPFI